MASIKQMNKALFAASYNIMEAAKHLSNVEEFREDAIRLLEMADEMAAIIKPEPEKVKKDKMQNILSEIMDHARDK